MLLLIIYIVLWIFLYYLEGFHDAFFTLETNEHPPAKDKVKANYYKGKWHIYDAYSYAIFHIGFAMLFAFFSVAEPAVIEHGRNVEAFSSRFLLESFILILVSVSLRMILHDMFFDLGMKRKLFIVPTCQGKWDFWDCWIVKLDKINPILPYFLRIFPFSISISIYYIYFI